MFIKIINVFQFLSGLIELVEKSLTRVYEESKNMLAFSYVAIPTRHTVHIKPED